jgi:6-phosphofructokinase
MSESRALVVLPRVPSAATPHIVKGLLAAGRVVAPELQLMAVRDLGDVFEESLLPLEFFSLERLLRLVPRPLQGATMHTFQDAFSRLTELEISRIIFLGGTEAAHEALCIQEFLGESVRVLLIPDDDTNSLGATDHCLGFGSFAATFANWVVSEDFDNQSFFQGIKILIAPGRETGWAAMASSLSTSLGASRTVLNLGPHVLCVPERTFFAQEFVEAVAHSYSRIGRSTVVVSEGVASQVLSGVSDHSNSAMVSLHLSEYLTNILCESRSLYPQLEEARVRAETISLRAQILAGRVSDSDREESYAIAFAAIDKLERSHENGVIGLRRSIVDHGHRIDFVITPFEKAAYNNHKMPTKYVSSLIVNRLSAEHENFLNYMKPIWTCSSSWKEESKVLDRNLSKLRSGLVPRRQARPEFDWV